MRRPDARLGRIRGKPRRARVALGRRKCCGGRSRCATGRWLSLGACLAPSFLGRRFVARPAQGRPDQDQDQRPDHIRPHHRPPHHPHQPRPYYTNDCCPRLVSSSSLLFVCTTFRFTSSLALPTRLRWQSLYILRFTQVAPLNPHNYQVSDALGALSIPPPLSHSPQPKTHHD